MLTADWLRPTRDAAAEKLPVSTRATACEESQGQVVLPFDFQMAVHSWPDIDRNIRSQHSEHGPIGSMVGSFMLQFRPLPRPIGTARA
jgi:hypothetical protein